MILIECNTCANFAKKNLLYTPRGDDMGPHPARDSEYER